MTRDDGSCTNFWRCGLSSSFGGIVLYQGVIYNQEHEYNCSVNLLHWWWGALLINCIPGQSICSWDMVGLDSRLPFLEHPQLGGPSYIEVRANNPRLGHFAYNQCLTQLISGAN